MPFSVRRSHENSLPGKRIFKSNVWCVKSFSSRAVSLSLQFVRSSCKIVAFVPTRLVAIHVDKQVYSLRLITCRYLR